MGSVVFVETRPYKHTLNMQSERCKTQFRFDFTARYSGEREHYTSRKALSCFLCPHFFLLWFVYVKTKNYNSC